MSDTLKLYPPPKNGRWKVEEEDSFYWVRLIIRSGNDYEAGCESVHHEKFDADLSRKRKEAFAEGGLLAIQGMKDYVPRTEAEIDKAIWEASRKIVMKHERKSRPFEYVTEWEGE